MTCCVCGVPAVVSKRYEDYCQFHLDCLRHELKIRWDAIKAFGQYHHGNCGPNFGVTFYGYLHSEKEHGPQYTGAGYWTHGYGLYCSNFPHEAMTEALRLAKRNDWKLLRLDVQGGAERRLGLRTCTNIYISEEYQKYMEYSDLQPLPYDSERFGDINL